MTVNYRTNDPSLSQAPTPDWVTPPQTVTVGDLMRMRRDGQLDSLIAVFNRTPMKRLREIRELLCDTDGKMHPRGLQGGNYTYTTEVGLLLQLVDHLISHREAHDALLALADEVV